MKKEFKLADYEETIESLEDEYGVISDREDVDIQDGSLYVMYKYLITVPELSIKLREGFINDSGDGEDYEEGFFTYGKDTDYADFETSYFGPALEYLQSICECLRMSEAEAEEVKCVVEW